MPAEDVETSRPARTKVHLTEGPEKRVSASPYITKVHRYADDTLVYLLGTCRKDVKPKGLKFESRERPFANSSAARVKTHDSD